MVSIWEMVLISILIPIRIPKKKKGLTLFFLKVPQCWKRIVWFLYICSAGSLTTWNDWRLSSFKISFILMQTHPLHSPSECGCIYFLSVLVLFFEVTADLSSSLLCILHYYLCYSESLHYIQGKFWPHAACSLMESGTESKLWQVHFCWSVELVTELLRS